MRKIPVTMATQHPDNASKPFWYHRAYISTSAEIKEAYVCFCDLHIDEYNWDWEGKFVDEAVIDRLLHLHIDYFRNHPLGKKKFLTFRIPNPRLEKQFRLARAFMVIITSSLLARSIGFDDTPIFETILPLTETASEVLEIQKAFFELVRVEHALLKMKDAVQHIEIIPLFEQVSVIIRSGEILKTYVGIHEKAFGYKPAYIRPYCARSDPALNSGLVPAVIAIKIALSSYATIEDELGVPLYPMVGAGSLPFRGGVSPETIEKSLDTYAGVKTLTVQSAFRYDFPVSSVRKAVSILEDKLHKTRAVVINKQDKSILLQCLPYFQKPYEKLVERLSPLIHSVSSQVERRRERMHHVGLFGYPRKVGNVILPRAIPFTAALYSVGLPPEIFGTGRGLRHAQKSGYLDCLLRFYPYLKDDIIQAGLFLNKYNVSRIGRQFGVEKELKDDIEAIEETFKITLGPNQSSEHEHLALSEKITSRLENHEDIAEYITQAGKLRKSLG